MTVSDLIEWLKTQDQEATVQVVRHTNGRGNYDQGGNASTVDFTLEEGSYLYEYTDWRLNSFVKPDDPRYGTRELLLGEIGGG